MWRSCIWEKSIFPPPFFFFKAPTTSALIKGRGNSDGPWEGTTIASHSRLPRRHARTVPLSLCGYSVLRVQTSYSSGHQLPKQENDAPSLRGRVIAGVSANGGPAATCHQGGQDLLLTPDQRSAQRAAPNPKWWDVELAFQIHGHLKENDSPWQPGHKRADGGARRNVTLRLRLLAISSFT